MDGTLQHSCENVTSESKLSRIERFPNDVLLLILSYSYKNSLRDVARTSILSRRWKNLWHNITCLDFNASTLLPPEELFKKRHTWYIDWVNGVINARLAIPHLPFVKEFRIRYLLNETHGQHIDSWIDFAIANQVEKLHLELSGYNSLNFNRRYQLSEASWYRAPSGPASLKCLKSLFLSCVGVSKQFVEFILSGCPLFEDLTLHFPGYIKDLDVSGVPLQLRRLKIDANYVTLTKLCAPYLKSLYINSTDFNPQKIDVPMLTHLTIGGRHGCSTPIEKHFKHFWSYLPQLEKLELVMFKEQILNFSQMPELAKLKYLKICVDWDIDIVFFRIIKFINACPLLETFALQIYAEDVIPRLFLTRRSVRKQKKKADRKIGSFKCLKVLELYGGKGKSLDQEVVKCIIRKAPNLEKVLVSLSVPRRYPEACGHGYKPYIVKDAEAKAKRLCQENGLETEITVVECCRDIS